MKSIKFISLLLILSAFMVAQWLPEMKVYAKQSGARRLTANQINEALRYEHVEGELIVKFKQNLNPAANNNQEALHHSLGASVRKEIKGLKIQHLQIPNNIKMQDALEYYLSDDSVEYAEPNYIYHIMATTPNDTNFSTMWGHHNTGQTGGSVDADIDLPEAWDVITSSNAVIAVIDTGIAMTPTNSFHTDLTGNIWINSAEQSGTPAMDDDGNGKIDDIYGWDFLNDDAYPEDLNGHGTEVAGVIAARGNNSAGTCGVLWQAKIMVLRCSGVAGTMSTDKMVDAINYAADTGAKIINISFGSSAYSSSIYNAIDYARTKGVLVIAAAGNDGTDNDTTPIYPASYDLDNIISVAATDHNDQLSSFSNYGAASVDLAAPGENIYCLAPTLDYGTAVTVYSQDFNSAISLPSISWNSTGTNSSWAIGTNTGVGSTNCLEDSPSGNYLDNTDSRAWYSSILASAKSNRYTLSYQLKADVASGDNLNTIYSSGGITWNTSDAYSGNTTGAFQAISTTKITTAADIYTNFYFGFGLKSDATTTGDGVYIDDITLTREPVSITSYGYAAGVNGTSVATPYVAGVAGLLLGLNPSLTYSQLKSMIISGVDQIPALSGTCVTGGRLNANKALSLVFPAAPSGLSASLISSSQINLAWQDNSVNEDGFKIERKSGSGGTYIEIYTAITNATSYNDTNISEGISYYYRVRAFNTAGDGGYSNEANSTSPLNAPTSLVAAVISSSQINLAWADTSNNESGFKIERKIGAGGTYSQVDITGANTTVYYSTGLSEGITYYYQVRAYNSVTDSAYSNVSSDTTLTNIPLAPTALTSEAISASRVDLRWIDNAANETGFKIERKTGTGGTYAEIASIGNDLIYYSDTAGLTEGTAYYYRIYSYNAGGNSDYSNEADATPVTITIPVIPSNLTALPLSTSEVGLQWQDNSNNEKGFRIERKSGASGTYAQIASVGINVAFYNDTGLSQSIIYYYRIKAYNLAGDSAYSSEASTDTLPPVPAAPSVLTMTGISTSEALIRWQDNSTNETGFKLERKPGAAGTYSQVTTISANQTSYTDTALTINTVYYYRLRAYNSGGNGAYSNETFGATLITIPDAAANLTATYLTSVQVLLIWQDNSNNETGFKIERKTGADGTYEQIVMVTNNLVTYSDAFISAGATYYYRARSYNSGGNSAYTNEVIISIPVPPVVDTGSSGGGGLDASSGGGGCFIATAAYGSPDAPKVLTLRLFRDRYLLTNYPGRVLVWLYEHISPPLAAQVRKSNFLKKIIRFLLQIVPDGVDSK